jgi:hypothetical protein
VRDERKIEMRERKTYRQKGMRERGRKENERIGMETDRDKRQTYRQRDERDGQGDRQTVRHERERRTDTDR